MTNTSLSQAKNARNDEFYTQWEYIEREVQAYLEFNPYAFRGKTILCPCDDPEWSNFTKFFALHFRELGHDANKSKIWELKDMDADHVKAWSKGGSTDIKNCQMLCKTHNQVKGNK